MQRLRGASQGRGCPPPDMPIAVRRARPVHQSQELGAVFSRGHRVWKRVPRGHCMMKKRRGVCGAEAQTANSIWSFFMDYLYFFFK